MITFLKRTLSLLLELAVISAMVGGAVWCLVYSLDNEARQVREWKKDPRTAILPVLPENR